MNRIAIFIVGIFVSLIILASCGGESSYEQKKQRELNSGLRKDSIFMGIYLGMTNEDFYTHCWELNKQKLIRQGHTNMSVQTTVEGFKDVTFMNFYPIFTDNKITEMPVFFEYQSWAPWNKGLQADTLMIEVLDLFNNWYGEGFEKMKKPKSPGDVYVKMDGNRRITIHKALDYKIKATITDMSVEQTKN